MSRSVDVTMASIVPLSDWKAALADVRGVIADAVRTPPSQADIDREANEIQAFLVKELENARNEPGARLADDMVRAVDIGETVTSPQGQVDMFKAIRASATPKVMLDISKAIFRCARNARRADDADRGGRRCRRARGAEGAGDRARRPARDGKGRFQTAARSWQAGHDRLDEQYPWLRAERIEFANGVTALISNNKVEPGKVRVNVRFGTGNRSVAADAPNLLWTGDYALVASGIGPWGQNEIDQLTNGRQIQMNFAIDDDAFELSAESNPADLADQMRLIAGKLAQPRWDPAPIERLRVGFFDRIRPE